MTPMMAAQANECNHIVHMLTQGAVPRALPHTPRPLHQPTAPSTASRIFQWPSWRSV